MYQHANPPKDHVMSLLTHIFFKEGVFRPQTKQHDLHFQKFVLQVLHCFPLNLPNSFHLGANNGFDSYLSVIDFTLAYITDNICM